MQRIKMLSNDVASTLCQLATNVADELANDVARKLTAGKVVCNHLFK